MNPFEYASPTKLEDAVALLSDRRGEAELLAGGTDLVTSLKQQIVAPKRVISLKAIPELKGIEVSDKQVRIGAMTTLAELGEHAAIGQHFPALAEAVHGIGSSQLKAMATLGGDLCQRPRCWYYRHGFGIMAEFEGKPLIPDGDNRYHAIFGNKGPAYFVSPSSLAPALIALRATYVIAGPDGKTRQVKASEFYRTPQASDEGENVLRPREIVTSVVIPLRKMSNATYEVRQRSGLDWPLVTASVAFESAASARGAQVVLSQVAPIPWPATKAAAVLEGKKVDEALARQAGQAAVDGAAPLGKNGYKVQLVKVAVRRAILRAAGLVEV